VTEPALGPWTLGASAGGDDHGGVSTGSERSADPGPSWPAAVRETHSAVVFLVGERAYKLKKPVDLGFLDFRDRQARAAICHREVELNQRLSPDVYLGVADVVGPDGALCDHLVVMRRMPDDRRLTALIRAGQAVEADLRRIAHLVAGFHGRAPGPPAAAQAASRDALAGRWEDNLAVLGHHAERGFLDTTVVAEVADLARRYLEGREALFERRIAQGRARDGHGDLLADDIFCLDDGPRILDCIEFADELRYGDVLADAAFLAMDLERLGRPDLAETFLQTYRELTADTWPDSLAHHHVAYRAGVRAKVGCIRWSQEGGSGQDTADLLDITARHLRAGRVRLVVVGGLPGTGKSTVATAVGDALGAVVIRSDEVRKELGGLPAGSPAGAGLDEGLYRPDMTQRTYRAVLERARTLLGLGHSAVLDATFADPAWRAAAVGLAEEAVADLCELRCVAPLSLTVERAEARRAQGGDPSDADQAVVRAWADREAPWPSASDVDTSGPVERAVQQALSAMGVDRGP
jgi:uncharacterized protein